ncbi:hypothetical protein [Saccharothrix sp. Mg75]|uniref:hypothetical protein n=1 Tax=Saccharothrix sp. Mg75 TaxID=3445357 RepID=UPI003EE96511
MGNVRIQRWHGQSAESELVENADTAKLTAAVDALDNKVTTEVSVELDNGSYLLVGGGSGRYHVAYGNVEDEYFTLWDEARAGGEEELVTGGQLGVFDSATVVDKALALKAAETFLNSGVLDRGLTWKED